MSTRRFSAFDLAEVLDSKKIKFISGKYFKKCVNGTYEEIRDIDRYIINIPEIRQNINNMDNVRTLKEAFVALYSEQNGTWPEMPIIKEARELTELKPMVFPLTEKQLVFINRIIKGEDEMMFILCGVGGSGKSTFANIVKQIFGNDVASLNLSDLSNDFKMATGVDKRLIYSDELNSEDLDNGMIKTLISKQGVNINPKFEKGYQTRWQSTLFYSCNRPPRLDLSDSGIVRRICYFSMDKKIENPDIRLQKREYTHEELVNIVAHALRVDTTNWFDLFKEETRNILKVNNSVWLCKRGDLEHTPYLEYVELAKLKGLRPLSEPRWQDIKDLLLSWEKESDYELPF